MERMEFKCEVITPMFIAGADGKTPELRAPSLKGALRFWWRALNGHLDLEELRKRETEIFGGTGDNNAQKSNVILQIISDDIKPSKSNMPDELTKSTRKGKEIKVNILEYLLYGIHEYKKGLNREYIETGTSFKIVIKFRDNIHKEEVLKALHAMSKFGGIGAKSRNGYGCLKIHGLENNKIDFSEYGEKKDYTSFSHYCQ